MPNAFLIPADLAKPMTEIDLVADLNTLQALVGGYIEVVNLPDAVFFINEEGKISNLPFNARATALGQAQEVLFATDFIVGDAVLLGWERDTDTYFDAPLPLREFLVNLPA